MTKSCDNCYLKFSGDSSKYEFCIYNKDRPSEDVCDKHTIGCISCSYEYLGDTVYREESKFLYKGKQYCELCLANELGIEIKEVSYNQYYSCHGDYLGDDNNMTLEDIMLDCSFVESLGEWNGNNMLKNVHQWTQ